MKIFISHSSKNKFYGEKLVDLLRRVGVRDSEIVFTSNVAYGIPVGQNIFNWLKSQITESPFVIYLLSEEYYKSIACLNEMGAAWIIENNHAAVFVPEFNLSSKEFQNGALDPREIGFYINDEYRLLSFLQMISLHFDITKNYIVISQSVKQFIEDINQYHETSTGTKNIQSHPSPIQEQEKIKEPALVIHAPAAVRATTTVTPPAPLVKNTLYSKFIDSIISNKLKDEELILLKYVVDTGKFKLMTGWQEQSEIDNIKIWEEVNNIDDILSKNYSSALRKMEMRGLLEVSAITGSNNPKEFKIKDVISNELFDLPHDAQRCIEESIERNHRDYTTAPRNKDSSLPF